MGCSPPSLPAPRRRHASFITADPNPIVSICGGRDEDGNWLASCLLLDVGNQRWEENIEIMRPMTKPRARHAVVTLKDIGSYAIGGDGANNQRTTDFLRQGRGAAQGKHIWEAGPEIPVSMEYNPCTIVINDRSFLAIYGNDIREYRVDIADPIAETGWEEATKWPQLQSGGTGLGCSLIAGKVVIAGGYPPFLSRTEILDLETRKIEYAGDLATPRTGFHIVQITEQGIDRVFALGGFDDSSTLDSVEEFDPETLIWKPASANLLETRYIFGAVAVSRTLVC